MENGKSKIVIYHYPKLIEFFEYVPFGYDTSCVVRQMKQGTSLIAQVDTSATGFFIHFADLQQRFHPPIVRFRTMMYIVVRFKAT